jgi:hypothetical protein
MLITATPHVSHPHRAFVSLLRSLVRTRAASSPFRLAEHMENLSYNDPGYGTTHYDPAGFHLPAGATYPRGGEQSMLGLIEPLASYDPMAVATTAAPPLEYPEQQQHGYNSPIDQSQINQQYVLYYFERIRRMQYPFAGDSVVDAIHNVRRALRLPSRFDRTQLFLHPLLLSLSFFFSLFSDTCSALTAHHPRPAWRGDERGLRARVPALHAPADTAPAGRRPRGRAIDCPVLRAVLGASAQLSASSRAVHRVRRGTSTTIINLIEEPVLTRSDLI